MAKERDGGEEGGRGEFTRSLWRTENQQVVLQVDVGPVGAVLPLPAFTSGNSMWTPVI